MYSIRRNATQRNAQIVCDAHHVLRRIADFLTVAMLKDLRYTQRTTLIRTPISLLVVVGNWTTSWGVGGINSRSDAQGPPLHNVQYNINMDSNKSTSRQLDNNLGGVQ